MEKEYQSLNNQDTQSIEKLQSENRLLKEQLKKRQLDINKTNSYYKGIVRKLTTQINKLRQAV